MERAAKTIMKNNTLQSQQKNQEKSKSKQRLTQMKLIDDQNFNMTMKQKPTRTKKYTSN